MEEFTQIAALLLPVIYWTRKGAFGLAVGAFQGKLEMSVSGSTAGGSNGSVSSQLPNVLLSPFTNLWNGLKLFGKVKQQYQNNPVGKIPVP